MLPVKLFELIVNVNKLVKQPSELGKDPPNRFDWTCITVKATRFPMDCGSVPAILPEFKFSLVTRPLTQTTFVQEHTETVGILLVHDQPDVNADLDTRAAARSHIAAVSLSTDGEAVGDNVGFGDGLLVG